MNIPFYRRVKYKGDGTCTYQCLKCGQIITSDYFFDSLFCCQCGIEYKGFILPKKIDYYMSPMVSMVYYVECGWEYKSDNKIEWERTWRKADNAKIALQLLKEAREEYQNDKLQYMGKRVFRLNRIKERQPCLQIPIDRFKLNKKLNRNNYQRKT